MLVNVFYCLCLSTRIDAGCYIVLIVEPVNRVERVALTSYMGIFPNLWTNPPTPGFLWDLGTRKVKIGSKKAIFVFFCFFFWGGGVPYIKPHIYVSQGFNLFICFTPFPNKWEPTSPFSPQTSISPHNLVNLPFCPKSFLNFPNQMKNLPFFRN